MRREQQLDDMIEDNRQLSVKLSKAQEERDAALLEVDELTKLATRLCGNAPRQVKCGLKECQWCCSGKRIGERVCACTGEGHDPDCGIYCGQHGTIKPCRHCLGLQGK